MKELSIEEKAKRYDEAIERAKEMIKAMTNIGGVAKVDDIQYLFPELEESEDVLSALKKEIKWLEVEAKWDNIGGVPFDKVYAWLEKQGEQRPKAFYSTIVETGNGDVNTCVTRELSDGEQKYTDTDNKFLRMRETKPKDISEFLDRLTTVEQEFLWEHIAKIRELDKEEQTPTDKVEPKFKVKYAGGEYNVLEVKDIAGVTFYGIEDEPNHIDYVLPNNCEIVSEQNPAWSEEDEEALDMCIEVIPKAWKTKSGILLTKWLKKRFYQQSNQKWDEKDSEIMDELIYELNQRPFLGSPYIVKFTNWLKSLKDKALPQPKQEWSEEDEKLALSIEQIFNCASLLNIVPDKIEKVRSWLKNLKNKVQPEQEWSEEDENRVNRLIAYFEDKESFTAEDDIVYANLLKSLRPQNRWKPSGEQIKVCKEVYADILSAKGFDLGTVNSELNRLEEQLKKLREE